VRDPAGVHVVFRDTSALGDSEIAAAVGMLSDEERAQCERFHFREDARDYAAAHALLRTTLSRDGVRAPGAWEFETTPAG
jgi:4'-phosphopantetheinyl transferase